MRTPRVHVAHIKPFRLTVHRYHGCEGWFFTCEPLVSQRQLESNEIGNALGEAEDIFRAFIQAVARNMK